jgi:hypothetical protein
MPRHEWDGTSLRFQLDAREWGAWVDLEGPRGPRGHDGYSGGGGSSQAAASVNAYFPAGW